MAAAVSPEQLALQEIVAGRYSIERELGRGGMGIVFLARDAALERPVAIKLLPPQLAGSDAMRQRFVREARTAARLSHPNIVPIHSVEEHGAKRSWRARWPRRVSRAR
jgi:eukaryotic-like serine/threonine-protein kinase